jgi:hypothetical protein
VSDVGFGLIRSTGEEAEMSAPRRSATIGLLAAAGFAVAHAGAAAAQPYTLRYAVDTERNINELSQRVAERQGFFAREGINLEIHRFVATANRESDRTALLGARANFDMARMQLSELEQIPFMFEHSRRDARSSCILVA